MPLTGLACPTCDSAGVTKPLLSVPGKIGFFCEAGHEWKDTETLMELKPRQLSVPQAPKKPVEGQTELRLLLGSGLIEALRVRFKDKLDSSAGSLLRVMLDPGAFVVVGDDAKRLEQLFGDKVPHADSLVGRVYALKADRDEWRTKAEQKQSAEATSVAAPNEVAGDFVQVTLRLTTDQFAFIFDKAKFNQVPPNKYLQNCIETAITNNWF